MSGFISGVMKYIQTDNKMSGENGDVKLKTTSNLLVDLFVLQVVVVDLLVTVDVLNTVLVAVVVLNVVVVFLFVLNCVVVLVVVTVDVL